MSRFYVLVSNNNKYISIQRNDSKSYNYKEEDTITIDNIDYIMLGASDSIYHMREINYNNWVNVSFSARIEEGFLL